MTRVVSAPNFDVPSLLKLRSTYQPAAPCWSIAADALETSRPTTSAGANTYLLMPARSQATMVDAASSPPVVWRFVAIEQSRDANFVATSAVIPAGSVAVVVSLESD